MTPTELRLWSAIIRRAGNVSAELAAKILTAFQVLRDSLTDAELQRAFELGYAEQIVAQIVDDARFNAAMQPVRDQIRRNILQNITYYTKNLPLPPSVVRNVGVAFDYLSPNVITAIRQLESRALNALQESTRETLRAFVEQGLREQLSANAMVRDIKDLFGLAPSQAQEVMNFRDALLGLNGRSITSYKLRNRTVDRLLAKGPLTPEQVDRYTEIYRKRRIAQNAYTNARTAAGDAQKLANRLAWQTAVDSGVVDGGRLTKTWRGVMDARERPEHIAMEGVTIPFNDRWPVDGGALIPGEGTYNCRCVAVYRVARA